MASATKLEDSQATFLGRVDSSLNPSAIPEGRSLWGVNVTFRGGMPITRPGMATRFNFPCGQPQGMTMFRPTGGLMHMVVVVGGYVYVASDPFEEYRRLEGIRFYAKSKFVSFADCLQTSDYDDSGFLQTLPVPKRVLIMQDGNTKAAFWDGGEGRHLNPAPSQVFDPDSGEIITQPGKDETKIGLWMAWAGNRLWVSRGPDVYASDLGNPLKFTESTYIAEGRKFTLPEAVTGMIQPSSGQPLIIFGENTISFLQANILDRTQWLSDPNFQRTEYGIGCVAPRSIMNKLGLVWWYSPSGWTNLNYAMQSFNDSRVRYFDKAMSWSKRNLSVDKSGICAGEIEDYTLVSVPSGDRWNRHTWVFDDFQDNPGWDGVWMGVRPVQWAKANIRGTERIFCLSRDVDGVNRVWEAMQPHRADNGEPISCFLATRYYNFGNGLNKRFQHAELFFREVEGDTELTVWSQSPRGPARMAANVRFLAKRGSVSSEDTLEASEAIQTLTGQFREIKTRQADVSIQDACGVCRVEASRSVGIDREFGLVMAWTGVLGVDQLRVYANGGMDNTFEGECVDDDADEIGINSTGCAGEETPYPWYVASAEEAVSCPTEGQGSSTTVTAVNFSMVSERDAIRKAEGKARLLALGLLNCDPESSALIDSEGNALIDEEENTLIG